MLDESVMRLQGGDHSVMHAQHKRLAGTPRPPNGTVQILPLNADQVLTESFPILEFGDATLHDVVYIERLRTEMYIQGETDTYQYQTSFGHLPEESHSARELIYLEGVLDIKRYRETFEHLRDAALSPRDSVDMIQPRMMWHQTRHGRLPR